jgi:hypothetical protein
MGKPAFVAGPTDVQDVHFRCTSHVRQVSPKLWCVHLPRRPARIALLDQWGQFQLISEVAR